MKVYSKKERKKCRNEIGKRKKEWSKDLNMKENKKWQKKKKSIQKQKMITNSEVKETHKIDQ